MSGGWRGVVGGVVGLSLLDMIVQNRKAPGQKLGPLDNVLNVGDWAKSALDHWIDPTVPLIPDHSKSTTAAAPSTGGAANGGSGSVFITPKYATPAVPQPANATT